MAEKFTELVEEIHRKNPRYGKGSYYFVRGALDFTLKKLQERGEITEPRHISGQQLLDGIREFALEQYGPMALTVLRDWGIGETLDFGRIVFILIDHGVLGKRDEDSLEDFADGYDFERAFLKPFEPRERPVAPHAVDPERN